MHVKFRKSALPPDARFIAARVISREIRAATDAKLHDERASEHWARAIVLDKISE